MAIGNRREGSGGIDFGADFSGLRDRPILKGVDLDVPTSIEAARAEELAPVNESFAGEPEAGEAGAGDSTDPLTRLLTAAEKERGLPYTFRIPISMDREFRTLAKEFDLDLSDIARSGLEMAMLRLRQMSMARKKSRRQ